MFIARFIIFIALLMGLFFNNHLSADAITKLEKITIPYKVKDIFTFPKDGWKIHYGDNLKFSQPNYNDIAWEKAKVDCSLHLQGKMKSKWVWYRIKFDLTKNDINQDLLLNLGKISVFEEVYINGIKCDTFGKYPKLASGASWLTRRYLIPKNLKAFKEKDNLLAIRVFSGYAGAMYSGIPKISKLTQTIYPKYQLKTQGKFALETLLSDAEHLNKFTPNSPMILSMSFIQLNQKETKSIFSATLKNSQGKILKKYNYSLNLNINKWNKLPEFNFIAPKKLGNYKLSLKLENNKQVLWEDNLKIKIDLPTKFSIKVDKNLKNKKLPLDISAHSMGHYGPRHFDSGKLVENFKINDARGGLAFSVLANLNNEMPIVFQTNICPTPTKSLPPTTFLAAKGKEYDGLKDVLSFGAVGVKNAGELINLKSTSDWVKKSWIYKYKKLDKFEFSIGAIHPAWELKTTGKNIKIFDGMKKHGYGLPYNIAYEDNGNLKVVKNFKSISLKKMSANWILVWFNGANGWNEFDIPWLLVFKHSPEFINKTKDALELKFNDDLTIVRAMPLYGVTLQRVYHTKKWASALPTKVVKRCKVWSKIMTKLPVGLLRTANIDFNLDNVTVNDVYKYDNLEDDWQTKGLKIAPVAPILPLVASSGNIDITINAENSDLNFATLHGPFVVVFNNSLTFNIKNLLKYVREIRSTKYPTDRKSIQPIRTRINKIIAKNLAKFRNHPWQGNFWRGKYVPGASEPDFTNLLLVRPYLTGNLLKIVDQEFQKEVENFVLYKDVANKSFAKKLLPVIRNKPVETTIVSSVKGLKVSTFAPNNTDYGIDSVCWESLRLYMLWNYAQTFGRYNFIKNNWEQILQYYNFIPLTHDWALGVSYDSFSGVRVGNGLQETGIIHAGAIAFARMANNLKKIALRDYASYYAVMQLVGVQGALAGNSFIRENRPTVAKNSNVKDIVFCEYYRPQHYLEFNELGGFTANIILPRILLNSTDSYIMTALPEIMRPYKEIWRDTTIDFFNSKYNIPFSKVVAEPLNIDMMLYMLPNDITKSVDLNYYDNNIFIHSWQKNLAELRALIDMKTEIKYRKLW